MREIIITNGTMYSAGSAAAFELRLLSVSDALKVMKLSRRSNEDTGAAPLT